MKSILMLVVLLSSSAWATTDYTRLWRHSHDIPATWLEGMEPQLQFLLGLMDRQEIARLPLRDSYIFSTGDENAFGQVLSAILDPLTRRSMPTHRSSSESVYLMYYYGAVPERGIAEDYALGLHELCHAFFDIYIRGRIAQDGTTSVLSTAQKNAVYQRIIAFNEFFADQCAIYQSENPTIMSRAVRRWVSQVPMESFGRSFQSMVRRLQNRLPEEQARDSVGPYQDQSRIQRLDHHFWFPDARRALWSRYQQIRRPTIEDRYAVLERLLELGWQIYRREAETPDASEPRLAHRRYDQWLTAEINR